MAICKKCNEPDLTWRKSAKGNWYLSAPESITTLTHGQSISIPFAHRCVEVKINESINLVRLALEIEHLQSVKTKFSDSWTESDELKLQVLEATAEAK